MYPSNIYFKTNEKNHIFYIYSFSPLCTAQKPGYYNGTEGKTGSELKTALHNIIAQHVDFSYSDAKYILTYADEDPNNTDNMILFYTKRSQSKDSWGSGSNDANREHVWAKSHGNFSDVRPMDGDAFNLHPADASVNIARSNYDFDECSETGTLIAEANAYYSSSASKFEPSDAAKGEAARTIFYMAVRYEGTNNEIDLEAVDAVGTYPAPEFGKLSTLLQWNRDFPPNELERRRNERVYQAQRNRNPFIDNPEFADLIWGGENVSSIVIGEIEMTEKFPQAGSSVQISATITGNTAATFYYGTQWDSEVNSSLMTSSGNTWTGDFDLGGFNPGDMIYYKIVAGDGISENVSRGSYILPQQKTLTPISNIQGSGNSTPMQGSIVSIGGIVTANFDNTFYMQNGTDQRNGMCVFGIFRGKTGDSIVITGRATEYNTLTEIDNVSYSYVYEGSNAVEPKEITIAEADEDYENMLVKFRNVTFLEGDTQIPVGEAITLHLTDGSRTIDVYSRYNSRLGGKIVPSGTVNVNAIVSQYNGTYQLLIDKIEDISIGEDNDAPVVTNVVVNDASWIEISFNEKIEKTSAENINNYFISEGVTILGAYVYNDTKVLLYVTGLLEQDYTLMINNVTDLQGNAISEVEFSFHSDFSSLGIPGYSFSGITIWPNPSNYHLFYEIPGLKDQASLVLQIISLNGDLVHEERTDYIPGGYINLTGISPGLYMVRISSERNLYYGKISIQK